MLTALRVAAIRRRLMVESYPTSSRLLLILSWSPMGVRATFCADSFFRQNFLYFKDLFFRKSYAAAICVGFQLADAGNRGNNRTHTRP